MARIQMTPMVKAALWALRVYLLVMMGLILFKFIKELRAPRPDSKSPATSRPATSTQAD